MSGMYRNRINRSETDKNSDTRRPDRAVSLRRIVQLISAVLVNGYLVGFQKGKIYTGGTKAVCVPVLNCYSCPGALGACPIGSLQAAVGGIRGHFPFYVLGSLMLFGIVLGRVVCGFLCPFGLVQDLLYQIPVPKPGAGFGSEALKKADRRARYLKYVILAAAVILLPAFAVTKSGVRPPYFCQYLCPAGTLGGGLPLMAANPALRELAGPLFGWKVLVLAVVAAASMLISRPFCRYLCPLGAFYGLFNRFSFFRMSLNQDRCIGCGNCERSCPMAVEVTKGTDSPECIRCGKCRSVCPVGAVSFGPVKGPAGRQEEPAE